MHISINNIKIDDIDKAKIVASSDFKNYIWVSIKLTFKSNQISPLIKENANEIIGDWHALLNMMKGLEGKSERYKFKIKIEDKFSHNAINQNKQTNKKLKEVFKNKNKSLILKKSDKVIINDLKKIGFTPPFDLTDKQLRDLKKILQYPHAANFSVPGSGKTAVALATHILLKNDVNGLLVVAPKNAFMAWDEQIQEIFDKSHPLRKKGLVRLSSKENFIKEQINSGHKNFIINYHRLVNSISLISNFMRSNKIHMILDESHKIKSSNAISANAARMLSIYPVRKDILTGTPMPNTPEDVKNQWDFLYPNTHFDIRKPFFARTTKNELKLPKLTREFKPVEMSLTQKTLYVRVEKPLLSLIKQKDLDIKSNFGKIKKSIMRLLQVSSNPILVLRKMFDNLEYYMGDELDVKLIRQIEKEFDSNKIKTACQIARKLASKNEKTVIWSFFRGNVERLGKELLTDLNAEYIHGGVATGDDEELGTREQKIKRFKQDPDCKVLVANYAACAEGISLHKACHNAIYLDRTFQAELYLQSEDRIHRLGNNNKKNIIILENKVPANLRSIDFAVRNNLERKIRRMSAFLNDRHLLQMANDEYDTEEPLDFSVNDVRDILKDFYNATTK